MTSNEKIELLTDRIEEWIESKLGIVIQDESESARAELKATISSALIEAWR